MKDTLSEESAKGTFIDKTFVEDRQGLDPYLVDAKFVLNSLYKIGMVTIIKSLLSVESIQMVPIVARNLDVDDDHSPILHDHQVGLP